MLGSLSQRWWLGGVLVITGCGGASPLLHPAHPLPAGESSFSAGVSGQLMAGAAQAELNAAKSANANGVAPGRPREAFLRGAVAYAAVAPGVAPFVGFRLGLQGNTEAGLSATGRRVRVDGRYAYVLTDTVALSVGAGASALLARMAEDEQGDDATAQRLGAIPGVDGSGLSGFGVDVPLLLGWRSKGSIVQLWAGPRLGYQHLGGDWALRIDPDAREQVLAAGAAQQWSLGGVLGLAVGLYPVQASIGVDVAYLALSGEAALLERRAGVSQKVTYTGVTHALGVAPAGALSVRF